jgi:hypothetical protein
MNIYKGSRVYYHVASARSHVGKIEAYSISFTAGAGDVFLHEFDTTFLVRGMEWGIDTYSTSARDYRRNLSAYKRMVQTFKPLK